MFILGWSKKGSVYLKIKILDASMLLCGCWVVTPCLKSDRTVHPKMKILSLFTWKTVYGWTISLIKRAQMAVDCLDPCLYLSLGFQCHLWQWRKQWGMIYAEKFWKILLVISLISDSSNAAHFLSCYKVSLDLALPLSRYS